MARDGAQDSKPAPPARKRRPPLVTPVQAVAAAYGLLAREGPAGLSMRKLASALHVSLPTVYTAVASRDALIGELQEQLIVELAVALGLLEAEAGPAASAEGPQPTALPVSAQTGAPSTGPALEQLGEALLAWASEHERLAEFLVVEPVAAGVATRLVERADAGQRAVMRALLVGVVGGPPDSRFDPVAALAYVIAQVRVALDLARSPELAAVEPARWLAVGRANVEAGLRHLAGRASRQPA